MLPAVGNIIEGVDWLRKRKLFLEEELARTDDEVTRVTIQAELDVVTEDLRRTETKRRNSWILGFRLPHQQD
jgi:hypothetical protein